MMMSQDLVPLGKTDIKITTVGVGTWAWGDPLIWGFGGSLRSAWNMAPIGSTPPKSMAWANPNDF